MIGDHPDAEVLASYAADAHSVPDAEAIERHLETCVECGETVAAAQAFEAELKRPETWRAAAAFGGLPTTVPGFLTALETKYSLEDTLADYVLSPLLVDAMAYAAARIREQPQYYTAGIVRRLNRASEEARETDATFALALANDAVLIAALLPTTQYDPDERASIRGHAWRERANALRYSGDYPAALSAFEQAREEFRVSRAADFDLARIDFGLATIFWKMERFSEALPLARHARSRFAEYGDRKRWLDVGLLEGGILFDAAQFRAALAVFLELRAPAEASGNDATLGLVYNALGAAYQELDDSAHAAEFFQRAIALFDVLGMAIERARTSWSLGLLALRQHRADAPQRLRAVAKDFERAGDYADAGLVALDLAEHLLANGAPDEVIAICTDLIPRFVAAGCERSAAAALAFLREASVRGTVAPSTLLHLRAFFRRLAHEPQLLFLPPQTA